MSSCAKSDAQRSRFFFLFQNLAAEKTYNNLDVTLKEANEHRNEWFEGVHKCKRDDTLFAVMEKIVKAEVHRLVVVDNDDKVCGVVSLSDILSYLVLRPSGKFCLDGPIFSIPHVLLLQAKISEPRVVNRLLKTTLKKVKSSKKTRR